MDVPALGHPQRSSGKSCDDSAGAADEELEPCVGGKGGEDARGVVEGVADSAEEELLLEGECEEGRAECGEDEGGVVAGEGGGADAGQSRVLVDVGEDGHVGGEGREEQEEEEAEPHRVFPHSHYNAYYPSHHLFRHNIRTYRLIP
jgi:hypothetical protein